jgi:hypothetical protein
MVSAVTETTPAPKVLSRSHTEWLALIRYQARQADNGRQQILLGVLRRDPLLLHSADLGRGRDALNLDVEPSTRRAPLSGLAEPRNRWQAR